MVIRHEYKPLSSRQINHKAMRVVVGIIALLLPLIVCLLTKDDLTSISGSYWTDSRDVFVGSLLVVGFFLSAYNGLGHKRDWEYWLSKLACVFSIIVGLFPTRPDCDDYKPAEWIQNTAQFIGMETKTIHYGAAVLLFICLICLMWFFSIRAEKKGSKGRSILYRVIGASMVIGIIVIFIIGQVIEWEESTFWLETWGLILFGFGWLVAGTYKSWNPSRK